MRARLLLLGAATCLVATSCSTFAVAAATVNGRKIPETQVEDELDIVRSEPTFGGLVREQAVVQRGQIRRTILTNLIRQSVLAQEASKRGIDVTRGQAQRLLEQAARGQGFTIDAFLRVQKLTYDEALERADRIVQEFELRDRVVRRVRVESSNVQKFYNAQKDAYGEVHLLRITVPSQAEASRVIDDVRKGGDFAAIARSRSKDAFAAKGGDMGWVRSAVLGPSVQDAISRTVAGGVTDPVPSTGGLEIYRVVARRTPSFASVRDDIETVLEQRERENRFGAWVSRRLRAAHVVVNPKYGRFDRAQLAVVPAPARLRP